MTDTLPDLLTDAPEIRGAWMVHESRNWADAPYRSEFYLQTGDWELQFDRGCVVDVIRLRRRAADVPTYVGEFDGKNEAGTRAEFERLRGELEQREILRRVWPALDGVGAVPAEFAAAVRAGQWDALAVAADAQQEAGDEDRAWLLRSAWANATGRANELVRTGRGEWVVLCPHHVTPKYPFRAGTGRVGFAAGLPGRVRLVTARYDERGKRWGIDARGYAIGAMAEYGSYNLVYFGAVLSITPKTVTVEERGPGGRTRRMPMGEFADRNHDFDLAAALRRNSEWMD